MDKYTKTTIYLVDLKKTLRKPSCLEKSKWNSSVHLDTGGVKWPFTPSILLLISWMEPWAEEKYHFHSSSGVDCLTVTENDKRATSSMLVKMACFWLSRQAPGSLAQAWSERPRRDLELTTSSPYALWSQYCIHDSHPSPSGSLRSESVRLRPANQGWGLQCSRHLPEVGLQ